MADVTPPMIAPAQHRLFDLPLPIIQAPMAGVSTPELAAAVSNAGGLGSLGLGASSVEQARAAITATRKLTKLPFNVNVFCHKTPHRDTLREANWLSFLRPLFQQFGTNGPPALREIYTPFDADEQMLQLLVELRPSVVSFHFGLPAPGYIDALRQARIRTMATATNLREAVRIEQAGIDAIVAQGFEAGGHRGVFCPEADQHPLSTRELVTALAAKTHRPIIAAGGIMDGQTIREFLNLGATGAQLGTAFLLCPEAGTSNSYRAHLKNAQGDATCMTTAISGRPARGLANQLTAYANTPGAPHPAPYPLAYDVAKSLSNLATEHGDDDYSAHWAGTGYRYIRELPARMLMQAVAEEMLAAD